MRFGIDLSCLLRSLPQRALLLACLVVWLAVPAWAQPVVPASWDYGTYSVGEAQVSLAASGGAGAGTYSWEVVSGSLPPGLSLRTDLPGWFPPDASAGLIGVATTVGRSSFTLRVTSGGQSANQVATLTITDLTLIDYWDMPHGFVGEPYVGHTFTVANAAGPVTWSIPAWSPLPPGLSLTPAGSLTGTPTSSGYYNITIGISDGAHTVYKGYSLPVYDVHITTPGILPLATQGSPYDAIVEAVGGSGSYTFTANSMPPGLVLDGATGHISGMPTNAGRWTINVSAVDGNGISYTKVFALWVLNPPASLPALTTGAALDDCTYGVPCARWIGANTGTPPFTWSATGLPAGMEIRATGATPLWLTPGDAVLIGSPLELGTYPVEVTATDATGASVTNTFSLRVSPLNLNPYPTGGTIDVPYSEKLRIIGGTGPYTGALTSGTLPAGVTLDGATLALSGTPAENGSFYPEFSVTDNAGTPYRIHPSLYFSGGASTVQINSWYNLGTARPGFAYPTRCPRAAFRRISGRSAAERCHRA